MGSEMCIRDRSYSLWDNVISRVEWMSTSEEGDDDDDTLAFNLVYSF